jgi:hypothetical protein
MLGRSTSTFNPTPLIEADRRGVARLLRHFLDNRPAFAAGVREGPAAVAAAEARGAVRHRRGTHSTNALVDPISAVRRAADAPC